VNEEEVVMSTSAERVQYIRDHFKLNETPSGWEALWLRPDGSVFASLRHVERAEVRRLARARWGHFNFDDEAEAFAEIFR
jgi:hypothetical protein